MATTTFARHRFTVKEREQDQPLFLRLEVAQGAELPVLAGGFLTLELREGTTIERAQELANELNEYVAGTGHTSF